MTFLVNNVIVILTTDTLFVERFPFQSDNKSRYALSLFNKHLFPFNREMWTKNQKFFRCKRTEVICETSLYCNRSKSVKRFRESQCLHVFVIATRMPSALKLHNI